MIFDPAVHHRRSIRLKGYDYTREGGYFITVCTHNREDLFGEIVKGEMRLNELGGIVRFTWQDLNNHVNGIELDEFVIMPNHIHGIIIIVGAGSGVVGAGSGVVGAGSGVVGAGSGVVGAGSGVVGAGSGVVGAGLEPAPTHAPTTALSEIVRQLKTFSARRINLIRNTPGTPVWQRNYYEHIIRNDQSFLNIAEYIRDNPAQWETDILNAKEII